MLIKFSKLIWEDISIGDKVEMLLSEFFLHPDDVEAKTIFPGDLVTLWEMVDFLVLIKPLIQVAFARGGRP